MGSLKVAKEWLSYANTDLVGAQALLDLGEKFYPLAAFHAQQSAEKAIKGFLVFSSIRAPKSHDIGELLTLVHEKNPTLAKALQSSNLLTDYAVAYRYPDAQKKALIKEDVQSAIDVAKTVFDLCLKEVSQSSEL